MPGGSWFLIEATIFSAHVDCMADDGTTPQLLHRVDKIFCSRLPDLLALLSQDFIVSIGGAISRYCTPGSFLS